MSDDPIAAATAGEHATRRARAAALRRTLGALTLDGLHTEIAALGWLWHLGTAYWDYDEGPHAGDLAATVFPLGMDGDNDGWDFHAEGATPTDALREALRLALEGAPDWCYEEKGAGS